MLQNLFSIRQFRLTKWSFLVLSTTRNAPYIHPSHDSILELWRTFPNASAHHSNVVSHWHIFINMLTGQESVISSRKSL